MVAWFRKRSTPDIPRVGTRDLGSLGTLAVSEEKTIFRDGRQMAMNNGGDTIQLLDPDGVVVQSVAYGRVGEGVAVVP